jgi:hypothetical protein
MLMAAVVTVVTLMAMTVAVVMAGLARCSTSGASLDACNATRNFR